MINLLLLLEFLLWHHWWVILYFAYLLFKAIRSTKKHAISLAAHALLTLLSLLPLSMGVATDVQYGYYNYLHLGVLPHIVMYGIIGFLLGYFVLYEEVVDIPRPLFVTVRGSFNRVIMLTSFVAALVATEYFNNGQAWMGLAAFSITGMMLGRLARMSQRYRALSRLKRNGEW